MSILFFIWRQRGRVVRDLKPGDPEFKSRSDHQLAGFVRGSPWFLNSSATLVRSQLVCLLPVVILNLLSSFQLFVSLALKNPSGEWSITYVCMYVCMLHTVSTVCNACSHNISQTPEKCSSDEVQASPTHLERGCRSSEVVAL